MGKIALSVIVSILILLIFAITIPTVSASHLVPTIIPLPVSAVNGFGIDPSLNKIFVSTTDGRLVIIDGNTDAVTNTITGLASNTINDGELAVNPVTHRVYITDAFPSNLLVIDGLTETSLPTIGGVTPGCVIAVTVNPVTNTIYGSTQCTDSIVKINGATGAKISTAPLNGVGSSNENNPSTNLVYNRVGINTKVYDGATNPPSLVTTIPDIVRTVNPVTNFVYSSGSNNVNVYDGNTPSHSFIASIPFGSGVGLGDINPNTNRLYVPVSTIDQVFIIDLVGNAVIEGVNVADAPGKVVVNPDNGKVYVLHSVGNIVSVFDDSAPEMLVGGTYISIDTTALLVAGFNANSIWMIPAVLGLAGAGIVIFKLRRKKSENS